jgi:uncharacterized glyoxalase superfamily protein PhnB
LVRHGEQPAGGAPDPSIPTDWQEKVLHARIEIAATVLMGAVANRFAMLRDRFGTSWMLLHQPESA